MKHLPTDPKKRTLELMNLLWSDLKRHNLNNEDSVLVFTAIVVAALSQMGRLDQAIWVKARIDAVVDNLRKRPPVERMSREDALALWDALEAQSPGFFADFPRDNAGPITDDDERVEIVRKAAPMAFGC